jgi:hypothetical protein
MFMGRFIKFLILQPLAANRHSGESRNPEFQTGCRIKSGMTFDTLLLCGRIVHYFLKKNE